MRIGVLTGGGDCPGLNAVIRAAVRVGDSAYGHEHVGIRRGWRGLLNRETMPLDGDAVSGILHRGGTILGTSRTNPFKDADGGAACLESARALGLEAVIAIGGEDTLGVAAKLTALGLPCVGVPKTIDNDLNGTDYTFGFFTAVDIATEAIDRLHTTAESHDRVMVVEVMGRHVGWIATYAGLAGGADFILIPEAPRTLEDVCAAIQTRHDRGKDFSIVVVSEGFEFESDDTDAAVDEFGHKQLAKVGIGEQIAEGIEEITGFETRLTVLGHTQRGGSPNAYDRILATRFGSHAAHLVAAGTFGRMVALQGDEVLDIPIAEGVAQLKRVPPERFAVAEPFFG
jgi:phosphofructokinase-like protein